MRDSNLLRLPTLALLALAAAGANAERIYGVTESDTPNLVYFDTARTTSVTTVGSLTGLVAGHELRAVDFRPSNGMLYAISSSLTANTAQLYTVNLSTGALTTVGSSFAFDTGGTIRVSMDFNPVADRLRLVSGEGNNVRINPDTGAVAGVDANLNYDSTDVNYDMSSTPLVADVAYTNNVAGATSTTLFAYDYVLDTLTTVGSPGGSPQSPNTGIMHTVGTSGGSSSGGETNGPSAYSANIGFDISGRTGLAYLTMDDQSSASSNSELFSVNLATGQLTMIGPPDFTAELRDFSVAPVPEPASMIALGAGALALVRRRRKA